MEYLNKVELQGIAGNVRVQTTFADTKMARIQLATNYAYEGADGCMVIDTTWHTIVAWEGENVTCLDRIDKGSQLHVVGRIRKQKYIRLDGTEGESTEIIANKIDIIE